MGRTNRGRGRMGLSARSSGNPFRSITYWLPKNENGETVGDDVVRLHLRANVYVVVDGSSRSYAPRMWAEAVASRLKTEPRVSETDWRDFGDRFEESLGVATNSRLARLREMGSQATAIVMRLKATDFGASISFEAVGDCLALVCGTSAPDMSDALLWPFSAIGEFPVNPHALSSTEPYLDPGSLRSDQFNVSHGDVVLLMSDALARYACVEVARGTSISEAFPFLFRRLSFEKWAMRLREVGSIENDDLSLIAVWVP
jgi:hypothetical protein